MERSLVKVPLLVVSAAMLSLAAGCGRKRLDVRTPRPALQRVPATAVVVGAKLAREDFALDPESQKYRRSPRPTTLRWLTEERLTELCRGYVAKAELFKQVADTPSRDPADVYLICRPNVTVRQYVRPSIAGTVMAVGTGFAWSFLGGSAHDRHVDVELAMDVLTPHGRPITTYRASSHSLRDLVTDAEDQLGPMVGRALTRVLAETTNRMAGENDLLMRALSVSERTKGPPPSAGTKVQITHPMHTMLRAKDVLFSGQVFGVDRPMALTWYLTGTRGGTVRMSDTDANSVKEFHFATPAGGGEMKLSLAVSPAGGPEGKVLAKAELGYLCVAGEKPMPICDRWAVVIGISDYADGAIEDLKYAHRDAEQFHRFLLSPRGGGFEPQRTLCLTNAQATERRVRRALNEFLADAKKDDLVTIFFSGHGMRQPDADNYFILCHDSQAAHMPSTAIPMWGIDMALRKYIRAKRVVVLADACHAGAIAAAGVKGKQPNPIHAYLHKLALAKRGRFFFTACRDCEMGREDKRWGGGHGAFTHFLLEGLKGAADQDGDGVVYPKEIVGYVSTKVEKETNRNQHPEEAGNYDERLPLSVPAGGK